MAHPNPRLLIPIVLVAALGIGGWYVDKQRARAHSTLSGFFESQPTQLASRIGGRVDRILVQEGDAVRAGQPMVILEADPQQAETEARQAQAEQARAQAQEVENGPRQEEIRKQEAVVREAEANLARMRHGARPEEINAARAKLHEAEALARRARTGPRPQEIEQAKAAEQVARAKLAQAERGLTPEEKAQARARMEAASSQEDLARKEAQRMEYLLKEGAISQQQYDRAQADLRAAEARRKEMAEALRRAEAGTPAEELEQARQAHRQTKAALDLLLAGTRREDIEAAVAEAEAARQNLQLLLRGTRPEEIAAGQARLAQAKAALDVLKAGSRKEEKAQAQAQAKAAAANARGARDNLEERTIRAPKEGNVERLLIAKGDLVAPGTPVIRMDDPNDLWLRVYVPEADLAKLTVGSTAELRVDGIKAPVPGVVESVASRGEFTPANLQTPDERGKQVFPVRLRLQKPDPRIKAGMYATVTRLGEWRQP